MDLPLLPGDRGLRRRESCRGHGWGQLRDEMATALQGAPELGWWQKKGDKGLSLLFVLHFLPLLRCHFHRIGNTQILGVQLMSFVKYICVINTQIKVKSLSTIPESLPGVLARRSSLMTTDEWCLSLYLTWSHAVSPQLCWPISLSMMSWRFIHVLISSSSLFLL